MDGTWQDVVEWRNAFTLPPTKTPSALCDRSRNRRYYGSGDWAFALLRILDSSFLGDRQRSLWSYPNLAGLITSWPCSLVSTAAQIYKASNEGLGVSLNLNRCKYDRKQPCTVNSCDMYESLHESNFCMVYNI